MRYVILLCYLLTLLGCASPDISAFKQSSLALSAGLIDNQTSLVDTGNEVSDKFGNPIKLNSQVDDLRKQGKKINQFAAVLAAYAGSVSVLSSAGTDGTEAIDLLLTNLQTTVTSISGNNLALPEEIDSLTAALGVLQQQQANKELYEIMQNVQGEVDAIATILGTLPNAEQLIVQGMVTFQKTERQDLVIYHNIYTELQVELAGLDALTGNNLKNDLTKCKKDSSCDYAALQTQHQNAITSNNDKRTKVQNLINTLMPYEAAYQAWIKDIRDWEKSMLAKIRTIPSLAAAWKKDHQSIIVYLETCTGFTGIFVAKCDAFSAANLELFGTLLGKAAFPF